MSISVNGKIYKGNSISIMGNKVFIDGKDQTPEYSIYIKLSNYFKLVETKSCHHELQRSLNRLREEVRKGEFKILLSTDEKVYFKDARLLEVQEKVY